MNKNLEHNSFDILDTSEMISFDKSIHFKLLDSAEDLSQAIIYFAHKKIVLSIINIESLSHSISMPN